METMSHTAETLKVKEAASKIIALRKLTAQTGFRTSRSQTAILHTLNAEELAAVAEIITKQSEAVRG